MRSVSDGSLHAASRLDAVTSRHERVPSEEVRNEAREFSDAFP